MALAKGTRVRVKAPVLEGEISRRAFDDVADHFRYLVPYTGADGEQHEGWFTEEQLETVGE